MSDLPDNYDPHDDLRAISDELMHTERAVFDTWIRVQHHILNLERAACEARDDEPARAGHPDIDSAGGDDGLDRAYGEKRG